MNRRLSNLTEETNKKLLPLPLFDDLKEIKNANSLIQFPHPFSAQDFNYAKNFLLQYDGNQATFINYRREIERLLQWSWLIAKKSILQLKRDDIENYIRFCQKPLKSWIGIKILPRFHTKDGRRVPNPEWRPFVVTMSKLEFKNGKKLDKTNYNLSQKSLKEIFVILGSFYQFLITELITDINPIAQIRQKSKFLRKQQGSPNVPRLSDTQWKCLIETTKRLADENPHRHQRTLFVITAMYLMYLRISEFVANERWIPMMKHFYKDSNNNWWFVTVGKGNKERHITVSDGMLEALTTWRKYLGLTALPSPQDQEPLIPKARGKGPVTSIRMLRQLIQECFDATATILHKNGEKDEATTMAQTTVHWLRHTGISDDINKRGRPIVHVRDDAGHASISTTDRYNDVTLRERHSSGKNKEI